MPAQNLPGLILDPAHPLARGLVGWWPLNEGAGAGANDVSLNRNSGLFANIVQGSTSGWVGGVGGHAVQFDGSDDIVSVPHAAPLALTGDMSIIAWVYHTSNANYRSVVTKGNAGAGYPAPFHLLIGVTLGDIELNIGNGSSQTVITSYPTAVVPLNKWTQIGATRLGSDVMLYMNGQYINTTSIGAQAVTDAGTALGIGARTSGTVYAMLGRIAHVRLYNRPLSSGEVSRLYADPLAGALAPSRLTRYYTVPVASPPAAATGPLSSDRLYNRSLARIFRRGETG